MKLHDALRELCEKHGNIMGLLKISVDKVQVNIVR